jgi:mycothiol synthase
MQMAQLLMKRPLGATALPPASPVAVREATRDDIPGIARLMAAAYAEQPWDAARVAKELFDVTDVPVVYVVDDGDKIIATASVRYHEDFPGAGYVHYVGVDPQARGRRLGTVVMARVMRRFAADGKTFSVLNTDDFRLPAIASYLGQGFVPQYPDADHEVRWSRIFEQLAQSRRTAGNR